MIVHSMEQLIGNTPMLQPERYMAAHGVRARLLLKLECRNPLCSVKDRTAYGMITDAEEKGLLQPGYTIVEATAGSAGIGLAFLGALRGYRVIITMPENADQERRSLLTALGAEVVLTPASLGMKGAIQKAEELASQLPNCFTPRQFENRANPEIHRRTTAREIWDDLDGRIDILVAGVGTGGTLTGTGEALKEKNPAIRVVAVEPADAAVLSCPEEPPAYSKNKLTGLGAGFAPPILNRSIYDEVIAVRNVEAFEACRSIARTEGLLLGASSGAALHAATCLAKRAENDGKTIVAIMPDTGERYLSAGIWE